MKTRFLSLIFAIALWTIAYPGVAASPVHITLAPASVVVPDADGFILLSSIATLSGGDPLVRKRMASIEVGRAPLPGDTRRLDPGDVVLKLRQAGFQPDRDATVDGARALTVTLNGGAPVAASSPTTLPAVAAQATAGGAGAQTDVSAIVIHRGDGVVIQFVDGALSITASGVAQESGVLGQEIRVRRPGLYTDLIATVIDNRTVALEP